MGVVGVGCPKTPPPSGAFLPNRGGGAGISAGCCCITPPPTGPRVGSKTPGAGVTVVPGT
jgi:hypothetical protein